MLDRYIDRKVFSFLERGRPDLAFAPSFRLPLVEASGAESQAKQMGLDELKAEPAIINFSATWCTACLEEKPYLDAIWKKRKKYHNRMISIATEDQWDNVVLSGRAGSDHFPILLDKDGKVARAFGIKAIPQTIVLDPQSRIILRIEGPVNSAAKVADLERMFTADVMDAHSH